MNNQILGFSGKAQSGKSLSCNFLLGLVMTSLGITSKAWIENNGSLQIKDILIKNVIGNLNPKEFGGEFNVYRNTQTMQEFLLKYLDPFVKIYSFADTLKQDICVGLLNLDWEQVYGDDSAKNSLTNINWEDCPGVITNKKLWDDWNEVLKAGNEQDKYNDPDAIFTWHEPGKMSAREVLQQVGTGTFRKLCPNVGSNNLIEKIQSEGSALSLICDIRFINEVEAVNKAGGKVIRLTRQINNDTHISESALDKDKYDWNNFYAVLDNSNMSVTEQCKALYEIVKDLEVLPSVL